VPERHSRMAETTSHALLDELSKIAEEKKRRWIAPAAIAGGALLGGGLYAATRPGLRAEALAAIRGIGKGGARAASENAPLHPKAVATAKAMAEKLRAAGFDPKTSRIGISATGGTGKSTLAKALEAELGMTRNDLDMIGSSIPKGRDIPNYLKKNPLKAGVIAEQSHLLSQVDPEKFDVMVHLQKPMEQIEKQILKRGRGAKQLEFFDYPKMDKTIRTAFEKSKGAPVEVSPGVRFKMKPEGGWGADALLREQAAAMGAKVPDNATREQLVHAAASGEIPTLGGIVPYVRKKRLAAAAGSMVAGGGAAGLGASKLQEPKQQNA
jgi:hypothetical protein